MHHENMQERQVRAALQDDVRDLAAFIGGTGGCQDDGAGTVSSGAEGTAARIRAATAGRALSQPM